MPEPRSVQVKWTVTLLLYQPFVPSGGEVTAALIVGAVLSMLTVRGDALVERPAWLAQEPLKTVPAVSVVWNWSAEQMAGPLIESLPLVETVTSLVYQPPRPRVPAVTAREALGPVLSSLTVIGEASVLSCRC